MAYSNVLYKQVIFVKIGHQHIQAPMAAAISPLAISPST